MHQDCTLNSLDALTQELGGLMRQFRDTTCRDFSTVELPQESATRRRNRASNSSMQSSGPTNSNSSTNERRVKTLNLSSVKFHFMGDYTAHIRHFGTTDSYSTQLV